LPLYDADDVERTLPLFSELDFDTPRTLAPGCELTLRPAGHILGSATALVEIDGCRVLFSGDLGRPYHPLLKPPADPPAAEVVVVESTYGDRVHPQADSGALADAINRTAARGGTVLIPAFAVDRTELVLLDLHRLTRTGQIPRMPVFVDSPMALRALEVYRRALDGESAQLREEARELAEAFEHLDLHPVRDPQQSERLNMPAFPCILVSASGMATGGRVVHHLQHQLPDPRNCVVLTGYQAIGTRGRSLLDGARALKMYGRYVPVRAEIVNVDTFSVHADADELVGWLARMPRPPATAYVVHGEPRSSAALVARLRDELDWCAVAPHAGERVRLVRRGE
ncbi:MAG TPA: MBL fold metallo-hydrolase, partial [Ornithinimicrobium sp.]|nr:MBL fold metallo-hydrolase [Ornithinimicrobium sp.]